MMEARMNTALANALKEKKELESKLAEVKTFIRLYERFVGGTKKDQNGVSPTVLGGMDTDAALHNESDREGGDAGGSPIAPPRTQLPREEMAPLIQRTLIEVGRPLVRSALLRELGKRGITIGGTVPTKNLGTLMWRLREHFVNIEGRGYWPAGLEVPEPDIEDLI